MSRTGNKKLVGYAHSVVERILPCPIEDWSPLLVIGNRKSGGANTDMVLNSFRTYFNPVQVTNSFHRDFRMTKNSRFHSRLLTFLPSLQQLFSPGAIHCPIQDFTFLFVVVTEP